MNARWRSQVKNICTELRMARTSLGLVLTAMTSILTTLTAMSGICYCTRMTSPGNYDFTITEVQLGQGTECDSTVIDKAFDQLRKDNPMGFPCPPCGGEIVNFYREVRGTCWSLSPGGITRPVGAYVPCGSFYWCMTPYRICCDEYDDRHEIKGATVIFGDEEPCDPGCFNLPCPN
jgi:hypothetical protein